jgi:hypothetical protein
MQPSLFPGLERLEPVSDEELAAILAYALKDGKGGRMTREAEVHLLGVCAEFLVDKLAAAGLEVVRRRSLSS